MRALFLACALLLAAPAWAQNTVRWGNNGEISTMDPHGAFSTANAAVLGNIYEPLVRHSRDLKFEPALATGWQVLAPDHYRFTIRRGVRFHDGAPLTVDDVVASLRRAATPGSPYNSVTHMFREVVRVDDDTVDLLLKGPYPVLINDVAGISILSEPWMRAHDALLPADPAHGRGGYTTLNANGTGPFRLVSRETDVQTVLERNPAWWDRATHNVDRIIYRPIPNDSTRISGLLSGELDLVTPLPLQDVDRIRQNPTLKVLEAQDLRVAFLGFNVAPDHDTGNPGVNPLSILKVRQAMAMALDIQAITRTVMRGLTQPIHSLIAPEIGGYEPAQAVNRAPFDAEGARRLLAEAGYPQGFSIRLECPNDRFVNGERVCQAAASMWARIGVKVSFQSMRYTAYMQRFINNRSDIFLIGWANTPQLDGFSMLNNVFRTRDQQSGSWNAGRYSDPAFDALAQRIAVEMDPARRTAMITEAFALERAHMWSVPLYREPMLLAMRANLEMPAFADGRVRFWYAHLR